jgi:hypothetical protein
MKDKGLGLWSWPLVSSGVTPGATFPNPDQPIDLHVGCASRHPAFSRDRALPVATADEVFYRPVAMLRDRHRPPGGSPDSCPVQPQPRPCRTSKTRLSRPPVAGRGAIDISGAKAKGGSFSCVVLEFCRAPSATPAAASGHLASKRLQDATLITLRRPISPPRRWAWVPPAATAFLFAAVAVALLILRARFLTLSDRLGVDPAGRRICSLGALVPAALAASRSWRKARRAARSFREWRP